MTIDTYKTKQTFKQLKKKKISLFNPRKTKSCYHKEKTFTGMKKWTSDGTTETLLPSSPFLWPF